MIYVRLILASLVWGLNIVIVKMNSQYFHSLFLVMLKMLFSTLSLLFFIYLKKLKFEKVSFKNLLINTNLINVCNFICTYYAMTLLSGCTSATLNCLSPIIMIMIILIMKKEFSKNSLFLILLSGFGFLLTIDFQINQLSLGHYIMLLGLILYNIGNYRIKEYEQINMIIYNFYLLALGFLEMLFIVYFFPDEMFLASPNQFYLWLFILTSGIGYAYIQTTYLTSIQQIGLIKTSFYLGLNPIFTYFFSIILLHEKISFSSIIGFGLIVVAAILKNH